MVISLASTNFGMTGDVWRKSPESRSIVLPEHFESLRKIFYSIMCSQPRLYAILQSRQYLQYYRSGFYFLEGLTLISTLNEPIGIFQATLPLSEKKQTLAKIDNMRNILRVLSDGSRKKSHHSHHQLPSYTYRILHSVGGAIGVCVCGEGGATASEHSGRVGPLYSPPLSNGIFRIR